MGSLLASCLLLLAPQAQAPGAVSLEGSVVELTGAPIAGAAVAVVPDAGPWLTATGLATPGTRSDAAGRWVLSVPEQRNVTLWFCAPGRCAVRYQHWLRLGQERDALTHVPAIGLPPAAAWTGRVRRADGRPLAGVLVSARAIAPSALILGDAVCSDEQGIFQLRAAPDAPLDLRFAADGFDPARLLVDDRRTPLDVVLGQAAWCSGRRLDAAGKPLPGPIRICYEDGQRGDTAAGANGSFRCPVRSGLRYRLHTEDSGGKAASKLFAGAAAGVDLQISAASGTAIEFLVLEAEGYSPVPGFQVSLGEPGCDRCDLRFEQRCRSGKDGRLSWPIDPWWQPGKRLAIVRAPGRAEQFIAVELDDDLRPQGQVQVALTRERTVSGVVVDQDGRPVAGARTWTFPQPARRASYDAIPADAVITGADGRFRLSGLDAADYALTFADLDLLRHGTVPVKLADGDVADLRLQFAAARRLELRWKSPPPGDSWLLVLVPIQEGPQALPAWSGQRWWRQPVSFERPFVLPKVSVSTIAAVLQRLALGQLSYVIELDLGRQKVAEGIELDLGRAHTGVVTGRVKAPEGFPFARLMVQTGDGSLDGPRAALSRDGSFALELPPGRHEIEVADQLTCFPIGRTESLDLPAGGRVSCVVPIAAGEVAVTLALPDGETRTAMRSLFLVSTEPGRQSRSARIDLADLRGDLRLLVPTGQLQLQWRRAKGALSGSGWESVDAGVRERVDVTAGATIQVRLQEPPRLTAEELARERSGG